MCHFNSRWRISHGPCLWHYTAFKTNIETNDCAWCSFSFQIHWNIFVIDWDCLLETGLMTAAYSLVHCTHERNESLFLPRLSCLTSSLTLLSTLRSYCTALFAADNNLIREWWQLGRNFRHVVCPSCWILPSVCMVGQIPLECWRFHSKYTWGSRHH